MQDYPVFTRDGRPTRIAALAVKALAAEMGGRILGRETAGYDEARRVWNGVIDRRPAFIVCCSQREDVARAVRFAHLE